MPTSSARASSKVKAGKPLGHGPRPYGWRRVFKPGTYKTEGFEHEPAERDVLRRMCRELLDASMAVVCARFNAEGIPTPGRGVSTDKRRRNAHWTASMMSNLLGNPMLWGEYQYGRFRNAKVNGRTRVVKGNPDEIQVIYLEPIVPREEVERVRRALAER